MKINIADKKYLTKRIPKIEGLIMSDNAVGILDAIDDWFLTNGFDSPDYHDYNDEGREMQRVRDRIYEDNVFGR